MMKRWNNRGRQRSYYIIKAFIFWCIISVAALIESLPNQRLDIRDNNSVWKFTNTRLGANSKNNNKKKDNNKGGEEPSSKESEGLARFFNSKKREKEKQKDTEEKDTESQGFFKSLASKWRESRKLKAESEEKEVDDGNFFSNRFNITYTFPKSQEEEAKEEAKKSSRLSVAQKFVSDVISKQKQKTKEEWVTVASKTSIAPGALVPITAAGLDLLLVASKDGSALHCVANSCPHLGTPLEIGVLDRRPIEAPEVSPVSNNNNNSTSKSPNLGENYIAKLLAQDGCEDCIVCPLHKTAFALESGEVRGVSIIFVSD